MDVLLKIIEAHAEAIIVALTSIASSMIAYIAAIKIRKHEIKMKLHSNKQQAIETIWSILFFYERNEGEIEEHEKDLFIRSLIWLPEDLRNTCLKTITTKNDINKMKELRNKLYNEAHNNKY